MLTAPEPTGLYYKMLAEERRLALKETLEENEKVQTPVAEKEEYLSMCMSSYTRKYTN